jgi:hypothetical protein
MATADHVGSGQVLRVDFVEGEGMSAAVRGFAKSVVTRSGALTGSGDKGQPVAIDPVTIITLLTTIIPQVLAWVRQCKALKHDEVQGFVASQQRHPKRQADQEKRLQNRIAKLCEDGKKAELKRAKETGLPADIGRFCCDDETITKLAHNAIGEFVAMKPVAAAAIVESCTTGA